MTVNRGAAEAPQLQLYNSHKISYILCERNLSVDIFDGVAQTNVVFDLCTQAGQSLNVISPAP
jgi:hypothetical protein